MVGSLVSQIKIDKRQIIIDAMGKSWFIPGLGISNYK